MGNLKINKDIQVQDSTRSFDWIRGCVEYLMQRDKSQKIEVIHLDIGNRYSGAGNWASTEIQVTNSHSTPNCKVTRNGNRLIIGKGVSAIILFSNINVWGASGQSEFDIITHRYRNGTKINEFGDFSFVNGAWTQDAHSIKMFTDTQEGDEIRIYTVSGTSYEVLNWSTVYCMVLQSDITAIEEVPEENTLLTLIQELQNYQPMWTEKQLFYSQNGTGSSFTLNESISNYDALEITCCTNDGYWYTWTQRVNRLNRSTIQVNLETAYPSGTMYYKAAHVVFSGTTATVATNYQYYPSGSVISGTYVLIQEVKGIKYNYSDLPASESIQELISLLKTTPGSLYNYSTSEQVIGTWINGKTLYRKVLTNVPFNTDSTSTAMGINNLDKILKIEGMVGERPLNFYIDFSGSIYFSSCWVYGNSLYTRCSAAYAGYGDVIIEYTKTTN